ncbi:hypothetical protein ACSSS7_005813 [Eimeria intestinalis]
MSFEWQRGRRGDPPEREHQGPPSQQEGYRTAPPASYNPSQGRHQPHSSSRGGPSPRHGGAPQACGGGPPAEGRSSWERRYGGLPRFSQQQQQQQQEQYMQQMLLLEQPQQQHQHQQHQVGEGGETEVLQQQCRESLRSSLRIVGETNQMSQLTAEQLAAQSEQLSRIAETTEEIGQNLEVSKYLLSGLKGFWGSLTLMLGRPPTTQSTRRHNQQQQQQQGGRGRDAGPAATGSGARVSAQQQQQWHQEQQQQQQQQQQLQQQALLAGERGGAGGGVEGEVFEEELERDLGKLSTMRGTVTERDIERERGQTDKQRPNRDRQRRGDHRVLRQREAGKKRQQKARG